MTDYIKLFQVGDKVRLSAIGKVVYPRDHPRNPHNGLGVISQVRDAELWGYRCLKVEWDTGFYDHFGDRDLEFVL